ncbi:MAG: tRNA pseudouridine(55) synthase TruB [Lachnospiraceae bacterium]
MRNGVLNVYKEKGFTSHDAVAKLRGIVKQRKIGHTGTLDPDATGVLPVCLGKATKLCDMLTDKHKTYQAVLLLGQTTDTQDTSGTVIQTKCVKVTEEEIRSCAASFLGEQMQIPPMYSALKVNGKKLYELAREGKEVERKARPVCFYEIAVEKVELPRVVLTVTCSKGTYIRTLCHDMGEKLGCGGCMESLIRTQVERFTLKDALYLSQIEQLESEGRLEDYLVPIEEMFDHYPRVQAAETLDKALHNGNAVSVQGLAVYEGRVRMYDSQNCFIGIYEYMEDRKQYALVKMFWERE